MLYDLFIFVALHCLPLSLEMFSDVRKHVELWSTDTDING